jgi:predicted molibdopterin-dependent oxidoreductase YjgC
VIILRIIEHPILGVLDKKKKIRIYVDGKEMEAYEGDMIASALLSNGKKVFRLTKKEKKPRGVFCAIGRCTDCIMIVDGTPNIRTCITPVKEGMKIDTQKGCGEWKQK